MSGGEHYNLSRNFQVQHTGDGTYVRMVRYRPGLPYVKHQKRVTNSSNVVARVHVGDSASAPRQTCPALLCAPAMAVAIKSDNAKTQLPPKRLRTLSFISFFRMSSILKVQNVLLHSYFRDYAIKMLPPKYNSSLSLTLKSVK